MCQVGVQDPTGDVREAGAGTRRKGAADGNEHNGTHRRCTRENAQHGGLHMPAVRMPSGTAGRVLWWGGLAAVAAFGVVDWPVAALVAAGSWVAEQSAKSAAKPPGEDREADHSRPAGERGKPQR